MTNIKIITGLDCHVVQNEVNDYLKDHWKLFSATAVPHGTSQVTNYIVYLIQDAPVGLK